MPALQSETRGNPIRYVELVGGDPVLRSGQLPPVAGHGDFLVVRPRLAGVCRSDLKELLGIRPVRSDFGHEVVGTVESGSDGVPYQPGTLVCLDPHVHLQRTTAFADLMMARGDAASVSRAFHRLPPGVPIIRLILLEPLACAMHCINNVLRHLRAADLCGRRFAVIGAGIFGSLIALLALSLGAQVRLFNRGRPRLDFLEDRGLLKRDQLCLLDQPPADLAEVCVIATEFVELATLEAGAALLAPDGLITLFGGTHPGELLPRTSHELDWVRRSESVVGWSAGGVALSVAGTYGAISPDFERASELLVSSSLPVEALVSRQIALMELPAQLQWMARNGMLGKVVVTFDDIDVNAVGHCGKGEQ
jgi:cyclitol reductase